MMRTRVLPFVGQKSRVIATWTLERWNVARPKLWKAAMDLIDILSTANPVYQSTGLSPATVPPSATNVPIASSMPVSNSESTATQASSRDKPPDINSRLVHTPAVDAISLSKAAQKIVSDKQPLVLPTVNLPKGTVSATASPSRTRV